MGLLYATFFDGISANSFMNVSSCDFQFTIYILLQCDVVEGKPVPKPFHRFHNIGEGGESSWLGSDLYQTAHVLKGTPHEVGL